MNGIHWEWSYLGMSAMCFTLILLNITKIMQYSDKQFGLVLFWNGVAMLLLAITVIYTKKREK